MIRMPVTLSRTTWIIRSTFFWVTLYMGIPLRRISQMVSPINGSMASRTAPSLGSMLMVTIRPPSSRIGARTPSLCIMPIIRCRL